MNQFVVTLVVILIPGIIAAVISDKITVHSKWNAFKFSLYAMILGLSAYAGLQLIIYAIDIFKACSFNVPSWSHLNVWNSATSKNHNIVASEVVYASILSLPVALFASFLINYKIFNKLAQKLKVSSKYGDENLYSYYLNAKEIDWVYVRDIENNLTYQGRIESYAENDHMQEMVLYDVTVFRYQDSIQLYSVPTIYLNKEMGKFIIEAIPKELLGEENDNQKAAN